MWTSFSTVAGGGVRGKDAGIAHITMTQVGVTIEVSHLFMPGYRQAGGMTTGIIVGKDIDGTTSGYITNNFIGTGTTGKRAGIGRSNKPGVCKV
jgi:hypothetical protein